MNTINKETQENNTAIIDAVVEETSDEFSLLRASNELKEEYADIVERRGMPFLLKEEKQGGITTGYKLMDIRADFFGEYFANKHQTIFEPAEKVAYQYNPERGLWCSQTLASLRTAFAEEFLSLARKYEIENDIHHKAKTNKYDECIKHLQGIAEHKDFFQNQLKGIHCQNCMLFFDEAGNIEVGEFSPDYRSRNQVPIKYDKNATCPRFLEELLLPATNEGDALLIQKYFGIALLGNNPVQRFLILEGEGGKGKSQLCNIASLLCGRDNCTQLRTEHLSDRFEIYRFIGKTLLTAPDVKGNFLSQKGAPVLKSLVGGDYMDAERKNHSELPPKIAGKFAVIITTNSNLQVRLDGDISAWKRRLLIATFKGQNPKKKIPDFGELLIKKEGSGILNWAIEGARLALEDIRKNGDISLSHSQNNRVDGLLAESDSLRNFIIECVAKTANSNLTTEELEREYGNFCADKGWSPMPLGVMSRQLPNLMLELFQTNRANDIERDGKNKRGYRYVKFIPENERNEY